MGGASAGKDSETRELRRNCDIHCWKKIQKGDGTAGQGWQSRSIPEKWAAPGSRLRPPEMMCSVSPSPGGRVPHPQAPGDSCANVTAELLSPASVCLALGFFCGSSEGTGLAAGQRMAPPVSRAPGGPKTRGIGIELRGMG